MRAEYSALILSVCAGAATCIGGVMALLLKHHVKPLPFAGALGFAAGVMVFVSFVDIYVTGLEHVKEGIEVRWPDSPHKPGIAQGIGMASFFLGWVIATTLDGITHGLMSWRDGRSVKGDDANKTDHADIELGTNAGETARQSTALSSNQDLHHARRRSFAGSVALALEVYSSATDVRQLGGWKGSIRSAWLRIWESKVVRSLVGTEPQDEATMRLVEARFVQDKRKIHKLGYFTALVLGIHNFPEGIATFAGGLANMKLGVGIAVAIGIHNIPEGLAIAVPILFSTGSKFKAIFWASLSGIAEPLGALLAWWVIGGVPEPFTFGILFFIIAGIMVNVAIKELFISALRYDFGNAITTPCFFAGMLVMAVSVIALEFSG